MLEGLGVADGEKVFLELDRQHRRLIEATGRLHDVRVLSMLLSALGSPRATFAGKELYPDLFTKGVALLDSLVRNHPFVDGKKRTATATTGIFLRLNGFAMQVSNEERARFTLACAQSRVEIAEIAAWLQRYSRSIP